VSEGNNFQKLQEWKLENPTKGNITESEEKKRNKERRKTQRLSELQNPKKACRRTNDKKRVKKKTAGGKGQRGIRTDRRGRGARVSKKRSKKMRDAQKRRGHSKTENVREHPKVVRKKNWENGREREGERRPSSRKGNGGRRRGELRTREGSQQRKGAQGKEKSLGGERGNSAMGEKIKCGPKQR